MCTFAASNNKDVIFVDVQGLSVLCHSTKSSLFFNPFQSAFLKDQTFREQDTGRGSDKLSLTEIKE